MEDELHLKPKKPYEFGNDHTDTMLEKKQAMLQGIDLKINYIPRHRRSIKGIMFGIIFGLGVWILVAGLIIMVWRIFNP